MKHFAWLLLIVSIQAHPQYSNVSATVTDNDSQTWNNGTYQITFVPPTGYNGSIFTFNGSAWTPSVHQGSLSSSGTFTYSNLERNDYIQPANSRWRFTICPNASVVCTSITNININQALEAIGPLLNLQQVRFPASQTGGQGSYGYADVEVSPTPVTGGYYFNVNLNASRVWNG